MIWNPSEGIHLGPITIRFYSLMFVVAFGLGWFITKKMFDRENESQEKLDSLFMWTFLATLLGARLGHVFFYDWPYFKNHLAEILLPFRFDPEFEFTGFTGLASHGAAIAIVASMYFFSKKIMMQPMLWTLDRVVIPVASGAVFVRLGNFFNSEIIGNETTSSFGIRFIRDQFTPNKVMRETNMQDANDAYAAIISDPKYATLLAEVPARHPTQLYEAFFYIFVFAILFFMYWKTDARKKLGLLFGSFLVLLFSVRFFVEFLKESQGGFESSLNDFLTLSTGQWLSIPMVLVGLYFVFRPKKV
jgi:phosphatidylglycerol---prolipoprotein diacylglyceryl transferase